MTIRTWTVFIFMFALGAHGVRAQKPSAFSGSWSVSNGKLGFQAVGRPVTNLRLNLQGPAIEEIVKAVTGRGDEDFTLRYVTDGSETSNDFDGQRLVSRAWWQGNRLVVEWRWQNSDSGLRRIFFIPESGDGRAYMQVQDFTSTRLDMRTVILEKAR